MARGRKQSWKKGCRLLIGKRSGQDRRADDRQIRLKRCSCLLALDQERARGAPVILFQEMVNEVGRDRRQIDEEESCGQETDGR